jgi:hypothetical protein
MMPKWYYKSAGRELGPVDSNQLARLALDGELKPDDWVRRSDRDVWVAAGRINGLRFKPHVASLIAVPVLSAEPEPPTKPLGKDSSPTSVHPRLSNRVRLVAAVVAVVAVPCFLYGIYAALRFNREDSPQAVTGITENSPLTLAADVSSISSSPPTASSSAPLQSAAIATYDPWQDIQPEAYHRGLGDGLKHKSLLLYVRRLLCDEGGLSRPTGAQVFRALDALSPGWHQLPPARTESLLRTTVSASQRARIPLFTRSFLNSL